MTAGTEAAPTVPTVLPSVWVDVPPFHVGMHMTSEGARGAAAALVVAADRLDADPRRATLHATFTVDSASVGNPADVPDRLETAAAAYEEHAASLRARAVEVRQALVRGRPPA